jgi:glycerol-3-phosphate dehydrogenase
MAEEVVDRIVEQRDVQAGRCVTASQPLVGAAPRWRLADLEADPGLVRRHGTEAVEIEALMRRSPELAGPVVEGRPYRIAELVWAVTHEGALDVDDLLDRRTRLGLISADRAAAAAVAEPYLTVRALSR